MGGHKKRQSIMPLEDVIAHLENINQQQQAPQEAPEPTTYIEPNGSLDFASTLRGEQYNYPSENASQPVSALKRSTSDIDMTKALQSDNSFLGKVNRGLSAVADAVSWPVRNMPGLKQIGQVGESLGSMASEVAANPKQFAKEVVPIVKTVPEVLAGTYQSRAGALEQFLAQSNEPQVDYSMYDGIPVVSNGGLTQEDEARNANISAFGKEQSAEGKARVKAATDAAGLKTEAGKTILQAIPSTADSILGLGIGAINPALGLAYMGAGQGVESFAEGKEKGMTNTQANLHAFVSGLAEAGFEFLPMEFALKAMKAPGAKGFMLNAVKGGVSEVGTEIPTTVVQSGSERYFSDKGSLWNYLSGKEKAEDGSGKSAIFNDIDQTVKQTLAQTLMMGVGGKILHRAKTAIQGESPWTDEQTEEYADFVGSLRKASELRRMGLDGGTIVVPQWFAERYKQQAQQIIYEFNKTEAERLGVEPTVDEAGRKGYPPLFPIAIRPSASQMEAGPVPQLGHISPTATNQDIDLTGGANTAAQPAAAGRPATDAGDINRADIATALQEIKNNGVGQPVAQPQAVPVQTEAPVGTAENPAPAEPPPPTPQELLQGYQSKLAELDTQIQAINDRIVNPQQGDDVKQLKSQLAVLKAQEKAATDNIKRIAATIPQTEGGDTNGVQGREEVSTQEGGQGQGLLTQEPAAAPATTGEPATYPQGVTATETPTGKAAVISGAHDVEEQAPLPTGRAGVDSLMAAAHQKLAQVYQQIQDITGGKAITTANETHAVANLKKLRTELSAAIANIQKGFSVIDHNNGSKNGAKWDTDRIQPYIDTLYTGLEEDLSNPKYQPIASLPEGEDAAPHPSHGKDHYRVAGWAKDGDGIYTGVKHTYDNSAPSHWIASTTESAWEGDHAPAGTRVVIGSTKEEAVNNLNKRLEDDAKSHHFYKEKVFTSEELDALSNINLRTIGHARKIPKADTMRIAALKAAILSHQSNQPSASGSTSTKAAPQSQPSESEVKTKEPASTEAAQVKPKGEIELRFTKEINDLLAKGGVEAGKANDLVDAYSTDKDNQAAFGMSEEDLWAHLDGILEKAKERNKKATTTTTTEKKTAPPPATVSRHLMVDVNTLPNDIKGDGHEVWVDNGDGTFSPLENPSLKEEILEKRELSDILRAVLKCVGEKH